MSRRSEVLPYSGEQSGGGDRCEGDKERRNQVIDHNTNDSAAGSSTDDVFAIVPGAVVIFLFLNLVASLFKSKSRLEAENARSDISWLCCSARCVVVFTLLIAIACSSSSRYRWYPSVLNAISIIRPETLAVASCRLTLFPNFARAVPSGSERIRCAARKPRITAPGREKLQQGAEQQG